ILLPLVRAFASLAVRYLSALLPASPNTSQRASTSNSTRGSSTSSGGTHSDSPADLRPDAHALFNAALDALEGCAPEEAGTHAEARAMRAGVRSVARLVALETARELAKLYAEPGDSPRARSDGCARRSSPATSAQKHAARVRKLAQRDAAWFLCAVLGRVLSVNSTGVGGAASEGGSAGEGSAGAVLLDDAVWAVLAGLLRDFREDAGRSWETGVEEGASPDADGSACARTGMGMSERSMLLAVLERAWIG
ncbi:hypothetical protein CERSUDRAFT_101416, partial [Gelatoporia subvermispora B]